MSDDAQVRTAERAIAAILRDLEAGTGRIVRSIALETVDVAQIDDAYPHRRAAVVITADRVPSTSWAV